MVRRIAILSAMLLMSVPALARQQNAAPARPRALTSEQLSERKLLGQFQGLDPALFGRIWRVGRSAPTCASAQYLALVYHDALERLRSELDATTRREGMPDTSLVPLETAVADLLEYKGRSGEAEQFLKQRLALPRPLNGEDRKRERIAKLQERLARLYTDTRPGAAEQMLKAILNERLAQGRANLRVVGATDYFVRFNIKEANTYSQDLMAPFYRRTGRTAQAIALYLTRLGPLEAEYRARTDPATGSSYDIDRIKVELAVSRAEIAEQAGRLPEAEALYRDCCSASAAYAKLLLRLGKRDEARVVLAQMMVLISRDLENVFDCMAKPIAGSEEQAIQQAQKRAASAAAERNVTNVKEDRESSGGEYVTTVANLLGAAANLGRATELGELLIEAGLVDDASDVLVPTFGLQYVMLGGDHPDAIRTLAALGRAVRRQGRPKDALVAWTQWQSLGRTFLRDRLRTVSEDQRRRFFRDDRRNVDQFLAALREAAPADAARQVLALSLSHKGMLASVAGDLTARAATRSDPRTATLLTQLKAQRAAFAALALHDKGDTAPARLARQTINELEAQLAAGLGATPDRAIAPETPALLAALKPSEALVDFLVFADPEGTDGPGRERMAAVIARAGAEPQLVWWDDVAPVRAAATRYRTAILSNEDDAQRTAELQASGRALNALLWDRISGKLDGVTRIYLGPDDILNVVPLAAMPDAEGRPLLQRYALATLSAPRDLLASAAPARSGAAALVIGNPTFGGAGAARATGRVIGTRGADLYFAPLPGTASEGRSVNGMLVGRYASRLLDGAAATKAAVLAAKSPVILHLATHGFFLSGAGDDPLVSLSRSGLALANANIGIRASTPGDRADGILTALEAVSLDLNGTQMVVLSACETGLGEIARGEGVYGLAQALHRAGARSVLATLWPVSDEATVAFMQLFYARIAAGDPPQAALRSAQLAFAQGKVWNDPLFWAPFVLTGRD